MSQMDSHKRKHEKQERGELPSVSPNQEGPQHLMAEGMSAMPPGTMGLPSNPGLHGLSHNMNHNPASMLYPLPNMVSEYSHPYPPSSAVGLDSSLNLGTDCSGSLFFLKNAAGLGLSDSLDLSKKINPDSVMAMTSRSNPPTLLGLCAPQDDTTGTSGDAEDDLSPEEEANAEEDDDEEDEAEEDLNTDSYEDSMPEPDGEKDNGESLDASINHSDTSQLEKQGADP